MGRKVRLLGPLLIGSGILFMSALTDTVEARAGSRAQRVVLIAAPRLTPAARGILITEASRIWERAGVRLDWRNSMEPGPLPADTLRVLAVSRPVWQPRPNVWVLGELLRFDTSKAIARVSLDEAERIAARHRLWSAGQNHVRDLQIGVVTGRAVAHEIGHYLLDTSTHAADGLMRATIDATEFADLESEAFDLDDEATAWVRQRIADGMPLGPAAGVSPEQHPAALLRFSYAD
jgi:hypothetical protein